MFKCLIPVPMLTKRHLEFGLAQNKRQLENETTKHAQQVRNETIIFAVFKKEEGNE